MAGSSPAMTSSLLARLGIRRLTIPHQAIQMHADMGGFGGCVGERDRAVKGDAGFVVAAKLHQEGTAHAEEMKIIGESRRQRLDHLQRRLRAAYLRHRN